MIRVVQDLTREELDELKQSYICVMKEGSDEPAYWDDLAEAPEYISDETLFEYYDSMTFTEDDFFCNLRRRKRNDIVRYTQGNGRSLSWR